MNIIHYPLKILRSIRNTNGYHNIIFRSKRVNWEQEKIILVINNSFEVSSVNDSNKADIAVVNELNVLNGPTVSLK